MTEFSKRIGAVFQSCLVTLRFSAKKRAALQLGFCSYLLGPLWKKKGCGNYCVGDQLVTRESYV